ncbi:unnamed protein product [Agarophyton chilense]|eukprot:gb/GEZJ01004773.1/.p1 GENE.gb/GEZJ01004773.1/~~gb/GEZJ01004773.1/.p1  ORF type:complete len:1177 (-),score=200.78 gb/GEZJ01004773.1/:526-3843(-)
MTDINLSSANEPPPRLHTTQPKLQRPPPQPTLSSANPATLAPKSSASHSPLKVSESMRRIQDMLSARKLTTSDLLTYTHNSVTFTAQIMPDGSLKASAQHTANPSPSPPHHQPTGQDQSAPSTQPPFKLYSSPSEFASDMASSVTDNVKSRGSVSVNGWNECKVKERSLAVLRNEMLRSKKCDASDTVQSPRSTRTQPPPEAAKASTSPASELQPPQSPQSPKPTPISTVANTETRPAGSQEQPASSVKEANMPAELLQNSRNELEPSKDKIPARIADQEHQSPGEEHSKHVSERDEKLDSNGDSTSDKTPQPPHQAVESSSDGLKSTAQLVKADSRGSQVDVVKSDSQNSSAKNALATDISKKGKGTEGHHTISQSSEPALAKESPVNEDKPEEQSGSPEAKQVRSPDSDKGIVPSSARDPAHSNTKKRMRSPAKQDVRKRKKKIRSDSPPSGARTPSNRKGERRSKEGKATDLQSTVDVEMVELDPEAREAAAIAAQAEKEEASSRARRTTRLAAGKIKQVDYKASANPQSIRTYSPGQENEENDGHYHTNETSDMPKSSRRRTAQNHSGHQLRTSRRVTRQRGSYERDMSSNDDLDHSGWRSGGNNGDKKQGSQVDADEIAGASRTNGMRNDRKRSRADNRRGRSNHSSDIDRGHGGNRNSPDNGSHDLPDDDEGLNDEEEMEEDEDPENRKGVLDLNMQDLTCIGIAIKDANSLELSEIVEALKKQSDWNSDESNNKVVASYVERINAAILNLRHLVSFAEDDISVPEALAFVATDILRLKNGPVKTGYPRRPTAILNKAHKEENYRIVLDRNRRKEQRDVDEARTSLEREMESRRKSELESLYADAQLSEMVGRVKREEARCSLIENEISRYEELERDVKARFDKAKLVHEKLHSEKRASDTPTAARGDQHRQLDNGDERKAIDIDESPAKRRKFSGSLLATSGDSIIEAVDDESLKQLERAKEMARLQALIAARQAEIEDYQRMCVDARMTFSSIADTKSRLETELHVLQSVAFPSHSSGSHGAPASHSMRSQKESGRKNEHKSGSGGGRNAGQSRSKPHGRSGTGTPSKANGSSKSKAGNGKHGENGKGAKRKTSSKH